jgi:RNA:NAD 2'-phosphotransferase (TPT1/KptA family)
MLQGLSETPWSNPPLRLYHGTTEAAVESIRRDGVLLAVGRRDLDFGRGFYLTTNDSQARDWAQKRAIETRSRPVVLEFAADRDKLASLEAL